MVPVGVLFDVIMFHQALKLLLSDDVCKALAVLAYIYIVRWFTWWHGLKTASHQCFRLACSVLEIQRTNQR